MFFANIRQLPNGSFANDVFEIEFVVFFDVFVKRLLSRIKDRFVFLHRLLKERFLLFPLPLTFFLSTRCLGCALRLEKLRYGIGGGFCHSTKRKRISKTIPNKQSIDPVAAEASQISIEAT